MDRELATRLRVAILRMYRQLRMQSLAGISPAQASVLGSVSRLGTPTLGELAAVEQVQPPSMTKTAAQLEEAGLVQRLPDAVDRRMVRIKITAKGLRTIERIRSVERTFLVDRLAALSSEQRAAAAGLVDLFEHLLGPASSGTPNVSTGASPASPTSPTSPTSPGSPESGSVRR
jgi:DNA-binding MarR family transcriptional regulator